MPEPSTDQDQEEDSELQTDETVGVKNGNESQTAEVYPKQSSLSPDDLKAPSASFNQSPASDQVPLLEDIDMTPIQSPDPVIDKVKFIPAGMKLETPSTDMHMIDASDSP